MGLVDYSDSDASDAEDKPTVKPTASSTSKPSFHKVVDRSNPGKIKVSLPQAALKQETKTDEPPTKRAKTGGGAFSGFNSFLPPPKRTGQTNATVGGGNGAKKGLGPGVNLKTGAAPGFSREPEPEREYAEEEGEDIEPTTTDSSSGLSLPPPKSSLVRDQKPAEEVKLVGKPLMFRPLSVSRKPVKKKKQIPTTVAATGSPIAPPATPETKVERPPQRPKVSLFSIGAENETSIPISTAEYKPMIYGSEETPEQNEDAEPVYEEYTPTISHQTIPPAVPTPPVSQSLSDIAGDLHLSAAERRQLFGRQKGNANLASATKIINFNTDQEYLHNEELRQSGEQVMHNPVRSIAPGKHSLKQLVNAAQSQKEALEESFAKGKSNRAEASSRYGW